VDIAVCLLDAERDDTWMLAVADSISGWRPCLRMASLVVGPIEAS